MPRATPIWLLIACVQAIGCADRVLEREPTARVIDGPELQETPETEPEIAPEPNRPPPSRLRVTRRNGEWRIIQTRVTDPDGDTVRYAVRVAGPVARTIGPRATPVDTTLRLPAGRYTVLGITSDGAVADTAWRTMASGPAPYITHAANRDGTALAYRSTVTADHATLTVVQAPADTIYHGPVPADTVFAGMVAGDSLGLLQGDYRFTIDAERSAWTRQSVIERAIPNLEPVADLSTVDATVRAGDRIVVQLPAPSDPNGEDRPTYVAAVSLDGKVSVSLVGSTLTVTAAPDSTGAYRVALTVGEATTGTVTWTLSGVIAPPDPPQEMQDTTGSKSGYDQVAVAGGATSVGADLVNDDETKRALLDINVLRPMLGWYYRLKRRLNDDIGLAFGVDYAFLNQFATYSASDRQAASGAFRIFGTWKAYGSKERGSGNLVFRVENRHRIGSGLTPRDLGWEAGSSLSTASFKDFGWGVTTLYWKQLFGKGRFGFVAGKMDAGDFSDVYPLLTAWKAFMSDGNFNNPAVALPQQGLGVAASANVIGNWYVSGGIHDANGSPTEWGFDTFFKTREYYTWVEAGWSPGDVRDLMSGENIHVNLWHQDSLTADGTPESRGVTVSASHVFGRWTPFLRAAYTEGDAALVRFIVAGGVGLTVRGSDFLGAAASWIRRNGPR